MLEIPHRPPPLPSTPSLLIPTPSRIHPAALCTESDLVISPFYAVQFVKKTVDLSLG